MLDGAGRSADAVADGPCEVWSLHRDALAALGRDHPRTANRLHANLALHLSQRLRAASLAWQASAG
jgi:CRP-like cAMP-binding protein